MVMGACSAAMASLMETPKVEEIFNDIFTDRRTFKPHENLPTWAAAHLVFAAAHKQVTRKLHHRGLASYPSEYETPSHWIQELQDILKLDSTLEPFSEFAYDLKLNVLHTCIPERYKSLKLLTLLHADRFNEPPKLRDIGCSLNYGLKMIASNIAFEELIVTNEEENNKLSRTLNYILTQPVVIGPSIGIDTWRNEDERQNEWVNSTILRPADMTDQKKQALRAKLDADTPTTISQLHVSFIDPSLRTVDTKEYEITSMITAMYQSDEAARRELVDNVIATSSDKGLFLVQDFASPDPTNPQRLHFADNSVSAYAYKTLVLDMQQPKRGFQELMTWKNARSNNVILGNSQFARETWSKLGKLGLTM
jgi:hypothetical protein